MSFSKSSLTKRFFLTPEIDKVTRSIGKSLKQYGQLPQPPAAFLEHGSDNLIVDETSYDINEMEEEFNKLFPNYNTEQLEVYNVVFNSVEKGEGGVFIVYRSGKLGVPHPILHNETQVSYNI